MRKSKRLLALCSTLLMLVSCFALPYGAVAAEETTARVYPNADPNEQYYVVGEFSGGTGTGTTSLTKRTDETTGNTLVKCNTLGIDAKADTPLDLSDYDTSEARQNLAIVLDVRQTVRAATEADFAGLDYEYPGTVYDDNNQPTLKSTQNQYLEMYDADGNQIFNTVYNPTDENGEKINRHKYLRQFINESNNYAYYNERVGDTIQYVIPWDISWEKLNDNGQYNPYAGAFPAISTVRWVEYNDSWRPDGFNEEDPATWNTATPNQITIINAEVSNVKIVDLTRDGMGYANGLVSMYTGNDPYTVDAPKTDDDFTNGTHLINEHRDPIYNTIEGTDDVSNLEVRFEAKAATNGYVEVKKTGTEDEPIIDATVHYGEAVPTEEPEDENTEYQVGVVDKFVNGEVRLQGYVDNTAKGKYRISHWPNSQKLTTDFTSYAYKLNDFKYDGTLDNVKDPAMATYNQTTGKLTIFAYNDNFVTWGENVANIGNEVFFNSGDHEYMQIGKVENIKEDGSTSYDNPDNSTKMCLPMTTTVKNVHIVDTRVSDLRDVVLATDEYVYDLDGAFAVALADARALLLGDADPEACADALTALQTAEAADESVVAHKEVAMKFSSCEIAQSMTESTEWHKDWTYADGQTGTTGVDLTDGQSKVIPAGSYTVNDTTYGYEEETHGILGANRYMTVVVTMPTESVTKLNKVEFQLRSVDGQNLTNKGGTERRTESYNMLANTAVSTENNGDGTTTLSFELLLDSSKETFQSSLAVAQIDWSKVNRIHTWIRFSAAVSGTVTINKMEIVDRTSEALLDELQAAVESEPTANRYTSASLVAYQDAKEAAADMLENANYLLVDVYSRLKAIRDALVTISPEYVRFGEHEQVFSYTNSGIGDGNQHHHNKTYVKTFAQEIPNDIDISDLSLHLELKVEAPVGETNVSNTIINAKHQLNINGNTWETKDNVNLTNADVKPGEWITITKTFEELNWQKDSKELTIADLVTSSVQSITLKGCNDLHKEITISVKNLAIIAPSVREITFYGKYQEVITTETVSSAEELQALLDESVQAPAIYGYTFVDWDAKDDAVKVAYDNGAPITAIYLPDENTKGTIEVEEASVYVGGQVTTDTTFTFDTKITVVAEKQPLYWNLDGAAVGFGEKEYSFYVSGKNTISPVFEGETPTKPAVALQQGHLVTNGSTYTFTVIAQTSLPEVTEGTTVEYGVLYSNKYSLLCALEDGTSVPTGSSYVDVRSSKTVANKQYMTSLLNIAAEKYRYARAYAIIGDSVVYSDTFYAVKTGAGSVPTPLKVSDYTTA